MRASLALLAALLLAGGCQPAQKTAEDPASGRYAVAGARIEEDGSYTLLVLDTQTGRVCTASQDFQPTLTSAYDCTGVVDPLGDASTR